MVQFPKRRETDGQAAARIKKLNARKAEQEAKPKFPWRGTKQQFHLENLRRAKHGK